MTINIWVCLHEDFFDFAFGPEIEPKCGTFAQLTLCVDGSSHLLDDLLADRKTKAGSLLVPVWILIELAKVDEQVIEALLWNANPSVLNRNTETHKALFTDLDFFITILFLFKRELFDDIGNADARTHALLVFHQLIDLFGYYLFLYLLDVYNINLYDYVAIFVGKLYGIWDEVQNNL